MTDSAPESEFLRAWCPALARYLVCAGTLGSQRLSWHQAPGDFGWDPLGMGKKDLDTMKLKEIKNGRLAMLAFGGILHQQVLLLACFMFPPRGRYLLSLGRDLLFLPVLSRWRREK